MMLPKENNMTEQYEPYLTKDALDETVAIQINRLLMDSIVQEKAITMAELAGLPAANPPKEREKHYMGRWLIGAIEEHVRFKTNITDHLDYNLFFDVLMNKFSKVVGDEDNFRTELKNISAKFKADFKGRLMAMDEFVNNIFMPLAGDPMLYATAAAFVALHSHAMGLAGMLDTDDIKELMK